MHTGHGEPLKAVSMTGKTCISKDPARNCAGRRARGRSGPREELAGEATAGPLAGGSGRETAGCGQEKGGFSRGPQARTVGLVRGQKPAATLRPKTEWPDDPGGGSTGLGGSALATPT